MRYSSWLDSRSAQRTNKNLKNMGDGKFQIFLYDETKVFHTCQPSIYPRFLWNLRHFTTCETKPFHICQKLKYFSRVFRPKMSGFRENIGFFHICETLNVSRFCFASWHSFNSFSHNIAVSKITYWFFRRL